MGCRLVIPKDELEPTCEQEAEPMHVTERPSSDKEGSPTDCVEPEPKTAAEPTPPDVCLSDGQYSEQSNSKPSVLFVRPAIISQLSDTVDLCSEMEEGELQDKSEAVLERIVRAQYQVDHQGDTGPSNLADVVHDTDARFKAFLGQFANKGDPASVAAGCEMLDDFDLELDALSAQLPPT